MRTKFELADVVDLFVPALLAQTSLAPLHLKVLGRIASCRTAALGGHQEACESCGTVRFSYNSCSDRHCLKIPGQTEQPFRGKLNQMLKDGFANQI